MKVRIEVTVEIDVDAWIETYGSEPFEVRTDVQSWARNHLVEALRDNGVGVTA